MIDSKFKFRAWDIKDKTMKPILNWFLNEEMIQIEESEYEVYNASGFKVMQFTGLTTRAGVDLYEGDICKQKRLGKDVVFEVIFRWGMFMAKIKHVEFVLKTACENDYDHNLPIEVIGNIYEDSHLLDNN